MEVAIAGRKACPRTRDSRAEQLGAPRARHCWTDKIVPDLPALKGSGGAAVVLFALLFRAETCGMVQTGLPGNRYKHRRFRDGSHCCAAARMLQDGLKGRCSTTELRPYGVNFKL